MNYKNLCLDVPQDTDYGIPFFKNQHQFVRELIAYRLTRGEFGRRERIKMGIKLDECGLLNPAQHMVNCFQLIYGNDVLLHSQGIPNNYALDIIDLFCNENDWGIAGCASSGKTFSVAACIIIDWLCAPDFTSTYVASTSLDASEDRLWGKVCTLYRIAMRNLQAKYGKDASIGNLVEYRRMIVFESIDTKDSERDYTNAIKALAFPKGGEGKRSVENTRGRKNARMRLFLDELAEMDLYALDTRVNLGANPDFIFGGMANPAATANNPHTELCQPDHPLEWESVNRYTHKWTTRTGVALHLSGEDSPNFQVPDAEIPPFDRFLTIQGEAATLKRCYGNKNALEYWRNVYGWWPDSSVELTIFSKQFIQGCDINWEPVWSGKTKVVCGFDPAFTAGGDRCAATFCRFGPNDTGRSLGYYLGTREYNSSVGEVFEESIAIQVVRDCLEYGVHPRDFGLDISGDGGKMMRAIIIEWSKYNPEAMFVFPISSMGMPTERKISNLDQRTCKEAYDRLVTEYWFAVHTAMSTRSLVGIDVERHSQVVNELCSRLYSHKGRKVSVEKKLDMKQRLKKSPDLADSFTYAVQMLRRAGLEFNFEEEAESLDILEIRDFENRLIHSKGDTEEAAMEEDWGYGGSTPDPDGF
jgi:hypothetical protein